jgi:hypothetical protein
VPCYGYFHAAPARIAHTERYPADNGPPPAQFIAANQEARADNTLSGSKAEHVETIRQNIRDFKAANGLDKVVCMWSANTERFCDVQDGLNTSAAELLASIERDEEEVPPSQIFAVACILEDVPYINGSPQNTMVPGVVEMAIQHNVPIAGDDFKSGQTKMKSVLVDFLVGAGIKVSSIVSYNHLGNVSNQPFPPLATQQPRYLSRARTELANLLLMGRRTTARTCKRRRSSARRRSPSPTSSTTWSPRIACSMARRSILTTAL